MLHCVTEGNCNPKLFAVENLFTKTDVHVERLQTHRYTVMYSYISGLTVYRVVLVHAKTCYYCVTYSYMLLLSLQDEMEAYQSTLAERLKKTKNLSVDITDFVSKEKQQFTAIKEK